LKEKRLLESTLIVLTAKHGDAPIDPLRFRAADLNLIPTVVNSIESGLLLNAERDGSIAMLWLKDHTCTADVVKALEAGRRKPGFSRSFPENLEIDVCRSS